MIKGMQTCPAGDLPEKTNIQIGVKNTQVGHANNVNNVVNIILPGTSHSTAGLLMNTSLTLSTEYYNLFVIGDETFCDGHFIVPKDRALTESITPGIASKYASLGEDAIDHIKTFPSLFASENRSYCCTDDEHEAYFGIVKDVRIQQNGIKIYFQLISALPQQRLNEIAPNLALDRASMINELGRTHWAIKQVNLLGVLSDAGLSVLSPGPPREEKNNEL